MLSLKRKTTQYDTYMNDGKFINYSPIHATGLFLYPLKTSGLLMLSRGIKRDHWHEMGRYDKLCSCYRGTLYPLACRKYIPTVIYSKFNYSRTLLQHQWYCTCLFHIHFDEVPRIVLKFYNEFEHVFVIISCKQVSQLTFTCSK